MDDLKISIVSIINRVVTIEEGQVNAIADHLISPEVMVGSIDDLADIEIDMLGATALGALPLKKIFSALVNAGNTSKQNSAGSSDSTANESRGAVGQNSQEPGEEEEDEDDALNSDLEREKFRDDEFQFTINWKEMPKSAVKALRAARRKNEEATQDHIKDLKDELAVKIRLRYAEYRKTNPLVTQKTPGIKVYRDVSKQVVKEFGIAMQVSLNKVPMCNGVKTLVHAFRVIFENSTRNKPSREAAAGVSRAKGVPGVLDAEHCPKMTKAEKNRATLIQKQLKEMALQHDNDKDWLEINSKMSDSFKLQRHSVVQCTKTILNEEENSEENSEEDEDLRQEKAIAKLKSNWPFLFTLRAMCDHHNRLTGRDLEEKLNAFFASGDIKFLLVYLTCSSSSNVVNAILRLQVEEKMPSMTNGAKLLLAICMVANHFKEQWEGILLLTAEQTILPEEVETIENLPTNICIVGLGEAFCASTYFICIDQECVAQSSNAGNAILMLMQLCFILDLEYPQGLAKTFEFIERIILEMSPTETRVKNTKGKILQVLTEAVKSTGKAYINFIKQVKENS